MAHRKRTRDQLDAELALHLKRGRPEQAAAVLAAMVELDRDDDRLFVRLAELRQKLGDEAGARAAWQGAADAAERRGFSLRAMAALRQLARTLPAAEKPWMDLSRLALRLGLAADALGFLDEGLRAWEGAGDRGRALEALRRCHEIAPDDVRHALRLAHALWDAGSHVEAVQVLRDDAARHLRAGREEAWLSLGRDLAALAPALALNLDVARALLARQEPRGALKVLRPFLEGAGRDREAVALAARALAELGKPVRPARPEVPPVLLATPIPGRMAVVAPAPPAARKATAAPPSTSRPPSLPTATPPSPRSSRPAPRTAPHAPPPNPGRTTPPPREVPPARRPAAAPASPTVEEELVDLAGEGVTTENEAGQAPPGLSPADLAAAADLADEVVDLAAALSIEDDEVLPHELDDGLFHAGFLVAHGFDDEARAVLDGLEASRPGHPGVADLRRRLAAGRERVPARLTGAATPPVGPTPAPGSAPPPAEPDLLADLVLDAAVPPAPEPGAFDEAGLHYDLGMAYREMGLLTDALGELEAALLTAQGARAVDCLVALAQCHHARGHHAEAARALERALAATPITPAGAAAAAYELGRVREARGDAAGAATAFEAAERAVPAFRDARAQAARLRRGGPGGPGGPGGARPGGRAPA